MMGYGYETGNGWMWGFGGLMMLTVIVLVGLAVWGVVTVAERPQYSPITAGTPAPDEVVGQQRTRQLLNDRYARGELTTDEYRERLTTLGF